MENKIVIPLRFHCWNMTFMQIFGKGPKVTIVCGNCMETFSKRIFMVDHPTVRCPYCQVINVIPLIIEQGVK